MSKEAYIRGFCKAAEAHGVDPQALAKFAAAVKLAQGPVVNRPAASTNQTAPKIPASPVNPSQKAPRTRAPRTALNNKTYDDFARLATSRGWKIGDNNTWITPNGQRFSVDEITRRMRQQQTPQDLRRHRLVAQNYFGSKQRPRLGQAQNYQKATNPVNGMYGMPEVGPGIPKARTPQQAADTVRLLKKRFGVREMRPERAQYAGDPFAGFKPLRYF